MKYCRRPESRQFESFGLWLIPFVLLILCFLCSWFSESLGEYFGNLHAYPTQGVYRCEDLAMTLSFDGDDSAVVFSDQRTAALHVHAGGRLIMGDEANSIIAFYKWNSSDNVLLLVFDRAPAEIDQSKEYRFEPAPSG